MGVSHNPYRRRLEIRRPLPPGGVDGNSDAPSTSTTHPVGHDVVVTPPIPKPGRTTEPTQAPSTLPLFCKSKDFAADYRHPSTHLAHHRQERLTAARTSVLRGFGRFARPDLGSHGCSFDVFTGDCKNPTYRSLFSAPPP
ncbi:hypothetical protein RHMOL_Rhmol01G0044800 [Rhododendron molle]|uniref:Uncharacterized protein n=1 Tax=Rhododendron molle TaxID=49168 RepID=A0ACC0Q0Z5_RHOML|nr:hypothetical protein RHMOL_Rhmol01G0044800 [Rhododendron molle]